MFEEVTINPRAILAAFASVYSFAHVTFGLVTHYHSVWQVRKHNKIVAQPTGNGGRKRIGSFPMILLFAGRMAFGLEWFLLSRVISPIGNRWHLSPGQISRGYEFEEKPCG